MKENRNLPDQSLRGNAEVSFPANAAPYIVNQMVEKEQELAWQGMSELISVRRRYSFDDNGGGYLGL